MPILTSSRLPQPAQIFFDQPVGDDGKFISITALMFAPRGLAREEPVIICIYDRDGDAITLRATATVLMSTERSEIPQELSLAAPLAVEAGQYVALWCDKCSFIEWAGEGSHVFVNEQAPPAIGATIDLKGRRGANSFGWRAQISVPIQNGLYYNIQASDGRYLTVEGDSYDYGAKVVLGSDPALGAAQFRFVDGEADYAAQYKTKILVGRNSGKKLFINGYHGEALTQGYATVSSMNESGRPELIPVENGKGAYHFDLRGLNVHLARNGASIGVESVELTDGRSEFLLSAPTTFKPPQLSNVTIQGDKPLSYVSGIGGATAQALAGELLGEVVPGGGTLAALVFGIVLPGADAAMELRADILDAVNRLGKAEKVNAAMASLASNRTSYLVNYLNDRKTYFAHGGSVDPLRSTLVDIGDDIFDAIGQILPAGIETTIQQSNDSLYLLQSGFETYVLGAVEHLSILQEVSLIDAFAGSPYEESDITTLRSHATSHSTYIERMYNYLLNWRLGYVSLTDRKASGSPDYKSVKLEDKYVGKQLYYFSGGTGQTQWDRIAKPMKDGYVNHLTFNYYNYDYAHWKEVAFMQTIGDATETMCGKLRNDTAYRARFSA
jgi:hypothetical protein